MNLDQIEMWTRAERLGLADFLDDLDEHEWGATPCVPAGPCTTSRLISLCPTGSLSVRRSRASSGREATGTG